MIPLGSRTWKARSPHSSSVSGIEMATPARTLNLLWRSPGAVSRRGPGRGWTSMRWSPRQRTWPTAKGWQL